MSQLSSVNFIERMRKQTDAIALVDLSDSPPRFLIVKTGENRLSILAKGSLNEESEELTVAQKLRQTLAEETLTCTRAAVLLSRPDLETVSGNLPPAADEELPALVASMVLQELDDTDRVVDFLTIGGESTEAATDVLAITCERDKIDSAQEEFKKAGFKLESMTYCGIGAPGLLREIAHPLLPFVVVITSNKIRTELVVLQQGRVCLFRTIQRGCDQSEAFADSLAAELQRTLAFVGAADEDAVQTYLVGDRGQFEGIASILSETLSCSVSVVDITDHVDHSLLASFDSAAGFANLIGVATAIGQDDLSLDFLNPRKIPQAPSRWRKPIFWGSIAVLVLGVLGWADWSDRSTQFETIARKQESLKGLRRRANRSKSLQNIVNAMETWQKSDITWIDELSDLSKRFPQQSDSLVRRLSAQATANGTGIIDLSMQVKSPEVVTSLETAIRDDRHSVSSKRVTEIADPAELTWSFETRITFRPLPKLELADTATSQGDAAKTETASDDSDTPPPETSVTEEEGTDPIPAEQLEGKEAAQ